MKPKRIKEVSRRHTLRSDGRKRIWYRDIYECPECGAEYEACRLNVNNGFSRNCGCLSVVDKTMLEPPVRRKPKVLNMQYLSGKRIGWANKIHEKDAEDISLPAGTVTLTW